MNIDGTCHITFLVSNHVECKGSIGRQPKLCAVTDKGTAVASDVLQLTTGFKPVV